ncbi:hypothetical protein HZA71_00975 [Candidatus Falkowbacteria bacterium]|nr:hypothetical protein [Candidatus Falkowbacteria bacterium]
MDGICTGRKRGKPERAMPSATNHPVNDWCCPGRVPRERDEIPIQASLN